MTTPAWVFQGATESRTNGHLVVLRFTNADPAVEMKRTGRPCRGAARSRTESVAAA